ncbi:hypothetical protein BROC_01282 [Candidatus Brocadiaceae bacterium]|nr:hypothetical protein BROC_01282 [Candidatus Brocadiaceae bacterium]
MGIFTFDDFLYVIMSTFANDRIDRQTISLDRLAFSNIRFYFVALPKKESSISTIPVS